jgi:hypothetical protein
VTKVETRRKEKIPFENLMWVFPAAVPEEEAVKISWTLLTAY